MADSTVDVGQLSQEQQDALQQYIAVTDQETKDAVPLLQRSQWNVQVRIGLYTSPSHVVANLGLLDCHLQVLRWRRARHRGRGHGRTECPPNSGATREPPGEPLGCLRTPRSRGHERAHRCRPAHRPTPTRHSAVAVAAGTDACAVRMGMESCFFIVPLPDIRLVVPPRAAAAPGCHQQDHYGIQGYEWAAHANAPRHGGQVQARV